MFSVENQEGNLFIDFCLATIWLANSCTETSVKGLPLKISLVISDFKLSVINCCTSLCKIAEFKRNYKSLVNNFTILFSDKNSFKITFKAVYNGTAVIIPTMPKSKPPIIIIKKISKG